MQIFPSLDKRIKDGLAMLIYQGDQLVTVLLAKRMPVSGPEPGWMSTMIDAQYLSGLRLSDLLLVFEETERQGWCRIWHELITTGPFYTDLAPRIDVIHEAVRDGLVITVSYKNSKYRIDLWRDQSSEQILEGEQDHYNFDDVLREISHHLKKRR